MNLGETEARRNAETATIPDDELLTSELGPVGPATKSDNPPSCELREGHRVHFVATAETVGEETEVVELYCADPHCDHHHNFPQSVNDNVSVETEETWIPGKPKEYDADGVYVGKAVLLASFEDEDNPSLGLTDVELVKYKENMAMPDTLA